jgi:hypothetical protein
VSNGQIIKTELEHPFVPDIQKIKKASIEGLRKYGHMGLVSTIRYYVKSTILIKNTYGEIKTKIKIIIDSKQNPDGAEKREISKFLKIISEYKSKIREIKHKIHEEEKNS